ncbi:hypothetical protein BKA69DRAFT_1105049 [Paraphysoderma sedebokerense]|nr:hypothetical protein BKA69DRAFT_1105041 [Paraphysoderma sedebokerense]KAI9136315.1 hypothetical protein BKA69DRAFT_1105049 [Paraphysoderma sedebokerense]
MPAFASYQGREGCFCGRSLRKRYVLALKTLLSISSTYIKTFMMVNSSLGNVCMQNAFPCSDAGTARNGSSLLLRHSLLPSPPTSHRHHIFSTSTDPSNMYYSPSGEKCLAKRIPVCFLLDLVSSVPTRSLIMLTLLRFLIKQNTPSGTSLLFPSFWGSEAKTAEEITQWLGSSPAPFRFRGPNGIMVFLSTLELVDRIFAISVARLIRDSKENYLPDEVEMAGNYVLMVRLSPLHLSFLVAVFCNSSLVNSSCIDSLPNRSARTNRHHSVFRQLRTNPMLGHQ